MIWGQKTPFRFFKASCSHLPAPTTPATGLRLSRLWDILGALGLGEGHFYLQWTAITCRGPQVARWWRIRVTVQETRLWSPISGSGRSPWRRKWHLAAVFLPGKPCGGLQSTESQRVGHDSAHRHVYNVSVKLYIIFTHFHIFRVFYYKHVIFIRKYPSYKEIGGRGVGKQFFSKDLNPQWRLNTSCVFITQRVIKDQMGRPWSTRGFS